MNWYALLPLAALLTNLMLLYLVYHRFKKQRNEENVLFLFIVFFVLLWSVSLLIAFTASDAATVVRYNFLGIFAGLMTPMTMLLFSINFAELEWLKKKRWPQAILLSIIAISTWLTMSTDLVNTGATPVHWGYILNRAPLYSYISVLIAALAFSSFIVALSARFNKELKHKHRSALVFSVVFAIPVIGGTITEVIAPMLDIKVMPLTVVLSTVMALAMGREILRHRFLGVTPSMVSEIVIRTMSDMLVVLNERLQIAFINRTTAEASGYRSEDVIGMPVTDLVDDVKNRLKRGKPSFIDFRTTIKNVDGDKVHVSANGACITDSNDKTIGYVISMRDMQDVDLIVGKLKHTEDELLRSTKELQKFNQQMSGRETTLAELKDELAKLENA